MFLEISARYFVLDTGNIIWKKFTVVSERLEELWQNLLKDVYFDQAYL